MLESIEVRLGVDYLEQKAGLDALARTVVYTGPIDAYFGFKLGNLEYRSVRFEWKPGDEPYYPVNDEKNGALYARYRDLAAGEKDVVFGGRLGEYKYYDMDAVIASALAKSAELLG